MTLMSLGLMAPISLATGTQPDIPTYEIYSVALREVSPTREMGAYGFVIQDTTEVFESPYPARKFFNDLGLEAVDNELLNSFIQANMASTQLENRFRLHVPYFLKSRSDINEIFRRHYAGWSDLHAKFPGFWVVRLSGIGINTRRDKAVVNVEHFHGVMRASGELFYLERQAVRWSKKLSKTWWVSSVVNTIT